MEEGLEGAADEELRETKYNSGYAQTKEGLNGVAEAGSECQMQH